MRSAKLTQPEMDRIVKNEPPGIKPGWWPPNNHPFFLLLFSPHRHSLLFEKLRLAESLALRSPSFQYSTT
jgi:hypothetical protein